MNNMINCNSFPFPLVKLDSKMKIIEQNDAFMSIENDFINMKKDFNCLNDLNNKVLSIGEKYYKIKRLSNVGDFANWFMFEEVTENVRMKSKMNEIVKNSQFDHKLQAMGEMVAGITHDINNPLGIILSNTEISKFSFLEIKEELEEKGVFSQLDDEIQETFEEIDEYFTSIEEASDRASKIVDGMRIFSRKDQDDSEPVNIIDLVKNSILFCKESLDKNYVDIEFIIPDNSKYLEIIGKEVHLYQVLTNFINNARDAVSELSDIQKWIKIELLNNKESVTLKIIDGGTGIPLEIQDKIMDPFFTTKKQGVGTGLGLSLSKKILGEHAATLHIDNDCQNTCFVIEIPKK